MWKEGKSETNIGSTSEKKEPGVEWLAKWKKGSSQTNIGSTSEKEEPRVEWLAILS